MWPQSVDIPSALSVIDPRVEKKNPSTNTVQNRSAKNICRMDEFAEMSLSLGILPDVLVHDGPWFIIISLFFQDVCVERHVLYLVLCKPHKSKLDICYIQFRKWSLSIQQPKGPGLCFCGAIENWHLLMVEGNLNRWLDHHLKDVRDEAWASVKHKDGKK